MFEFEHDINNNIIIWNMYRIIFSSFFFNSVKNVIDVSNNATNQARANAKLRRCIKSSILPKLEIAHLKRVG